MKKKPWKSLYKNALQLTLVGGVTGIAVGVVVTLYNLLFAYGEGIARGSYETIRNNPVWIPLLVVALLMAAFLVSSAMQASKIIRGCGVPQMKAESGIGLRPLWWRDATLMFAVTIVEVFMGMSIGSEGGSVLMGRAIGSGIGGALKGNFMVRRYQVTGGACAGLAVAANAPLTGMVFAFEEAHKRFAPAISICAFFSVVFAMLTRTLLYAIFKLPIENCFTTFRFSGVGLPLSCYPFVLAAGIVVGAFGILFYRGVFGIRKLFRKISIKNSFLQDFIKVSIAFLLGGAIVVMAVDVLGGGHHLVESLGSAAEHGVSSLFGEPVVWTLIIVALLKGLAICLNVSANVPCGIFIPVIAVGACMGGALNQAWLALGMDAQYCDLMLAICMAAFFASIFKSPITSIIMVCEFTCSFAPLLPVIIGVSISYFLSDISHADSVHDRLLEEEDVDAEDMQTEYFELKVAGGSLADNSQIRGVFWPSGARVVQIVREGEVLHPEGATVLSAGDILTIVCKTDDRATSLDDLQYIVGT